MGIIRRSPASRRDYCEIWDYLAQFDAQVADQTLLDLDSKLKLLSEFPYAGRARHNIRPRLRSFPVGKYVLFYRPMRVGVELVRAVHSSRSLRKIFPPR